MCTSFVVLVSISFVVLVSISFTGLCCIYSAEVCKKTCEHGEVDYRECNCKCKHLWTGPNCGKYIYILYLLIYKIIYYLIYVYCFIAKL